MKCSNTREKAAEYFQSQGFTRASCFLSLVVNKNGTKIGWYYNHHGKLAISFRHGEHEMLDAFPAGFRIIASNTNFMFEGRICKYQYNGSMTAQRFRGAALHGIKIIHEVLSSKDVAGLGLSAKIYHCFGVYEKESQKLVNCMWAAGAPNNFEHQVMVFSQIKTCYDPKIHSLRRFSFEEEFEFDGRHWMLHTSQGLPCLCELDLRFRTRITERRSGKAKFYDTQI